MNCKQARKKIPLLAGEELPAPERQALAEHLHACAACRSLAQEYQHLHERSRHILQPQEPPGFYDDFSGEVLQRLPHMKATPGRSQARPRQHRWNWRPAPAWAAAAAIAAVFFLVLILIRADLQTFFRPRTTLQAYLQQQDFQGLARALADARTREALLQDSVSVDLLLQTVQELARLNRRDRRVSRYIAQSLRWSWNESPPGTAIRSLFCIQSPTGNFSFQKTIRGLRLVGQSHKKVTLSEIAAMAERYCRT